MEIDQFYYYCWNEMPSEPQAKFLELILNKDKPRIVCTAGTQTGKTKACATAVVYLSLFYPKINIILVSAQYNWIYDWVCKIFNNHPEFAVYVVVKGVGFPIPKYGFSLSSGSVCHICSATEPSLKGTPADIVFLDEATEIKHDIFLQCLDRISGEWSKFIIISTARGKYERWFLELIDDRVKRGWEYITWSAEDCSWHKKDTLKYKLKEYGKLRYRIEVLGLVPTKQERTLWKSSEIDKCISTEVLTEGMPRECGLDFAETRGKTVITVIERCRSRIKVLYYKYWTGKHIDSIAEELAKIAEQYKCVLIKADSKPVVFQHVIEKYTNIPIQYIDATFAKKELVGQLSRFIKTHHLELSENHKELIMELKKYKRNMSQGDDLVDSLCFACYEQKNKPIYKAVCKIV